MNLLNCLEVASDLGTINRYSKNKLSNPESVMEHTGFVSMICYFIGSKCNEAESNSIDIGSLLSRCVVHDIDEFITGDVQRPTKYSSPEMIDLFLGLSSECVVNISEKLSIKSVYDDWRVAKEGKEGSIVAFADTFSVVYKAFDEVYMRGNKTLQFGSTNEMRKLIKKRISGMEMQGVTESVIQDFYFNCEALLSKIDEVLR